MAGIILIILGIVLLGGGFHYGPWFGGMWRRRPPMGGPHGPMGFGGPHGPMGGFGGPRGPMGGGFGGGHRGGFGGPGR